jgi:surfactin synthase thioesterase subunit
MWLRDALPHHITREADQKPYARVMVYGYESGLSQSRSIQNLEDLATSLHTNLLELVSATTSRPIVFIAHSLGGLIVKQVCYILGNASVIILTRW